MTVLELAVRNTPRMDGYGKSSYAYVYIGKCPTLLPTVSEMYIFWNNFGKFCLFYVTSIIE